MAWHPLGARPIIISFPFVPTTRYTQYGRSVGTYQLAARQPADSAHFRTAMQYHAPACSDRKRRSRLPGALEIAKPVMPLDDTLRVADQPAPGQRARVGSTTGPIASLRCPLVL